MDIFGIGALEILFILVIALLVLGPHELVKTGKTIGRFLRKLVMSDSWQTIQQASREMRNLPNRLMREAGIEDMEKEFKDLDITKDLDELKVEDHTKEIGKSIKDEMREINKGMSAWTTTPAAKDTNESTESETEPIPSSETQESGEPSGVDVEENRIAPPDHETHTEAVTEQNHNDEKGDQ
jgi:sec-independent protein translocase protein TatB